MKTINKIPCPHCGRAINKREVVIYDGMVKALSAVYLFCKSKNRWTNWKPKEFNHLLGPNEIQRFRDWKYLAPKLVSGPHGMFDFNELIIQKFLAGKEPIPTRILKDPITKKIDYFDSKFVKDILPLYALIDDTEFVVKYKVPPKINTFGVEPSKSVLGESYTVDTLPNGKVKCSCKGFRYRKTCRHITEYLNQQQLPL